MLGQRQEELPQAGVPKSSANRAGEGREDGDVVSDMSLIAFKIVKGPCKESHLPQQKVA